MTTNNTIEDTNAYAALAHQSATMTAIIDDPDIKRRGEIMLELTTTLSKYQIPAEEAVAILYSMAFALAEPLGINLETDMEREDIEVQPE